MQLLAILLNFEHKKRMVGVGRWVLGGGSPLTFSGLPVTACYNTLTPLVTIWGCFVYIYFRFVFVLFVKFPIIGRCPCPLGKMSQNLDIRFFIFLTFHCYLAVLK